MKRPHAPWDWNDGAIVLAMAAGMWEGTLVVDANSSWWADFVRSDPTVTVFIVSAAIAWPILLWMASLEFVSRGRRLTRRLVKAGLGFAGRDEREAFEFDEDRGVQSYRGEQEAWRAEARRFLGRVPEDPRPSERKP